MALQEVCGFQDTPVYPRWNAPASLSMDTGHTILHSSGWDGAEPNSTGGGVDCGGPLNWYIPDPEHLTQNPLQAIAPPFQLCHGTTTLAFVFQGGIIAAGDSRASAAGLICSPTAQKVLPVHGRLVMTMSGSAADCVLWKGILARQLRLYHLRHRRQLSVGGAAKLLSHMLHPFKGTDVCVATLLCGWEGAEEGPKGGGARREEESGGKRTLDRDGDKQDRTEKESISGRGRGREREPIGERGRGTGPIGGRETEPIRGSRAEVEGGKTDLVLNKPVGTRSLLEAPTGEAKPKQKTESKPGGPEGEGEGGHISAGWGSGVRIPGPSGPSGPRLYYVCSDGTRLQGELFSVGSGSPYAYSVLDGGVRWGMGVAEARRLAREAVYRAAHRDAYSGNCVDLYHVTSQGWRRRETEDLKEEYYRERGREGEEEEEGW